jgi:drug/metabolite transporter (DMT)-like permease
VVVTNNYLYASPFVTLLAGYLLLHEPISLMGVVGAVLITIGVFLAQRAETD